MHGIKHIDKLLVSDNTKQGNDESTSGLYGGVVKGWKDRLKTGSNQSLRGLAESLSEDEDGNMTEGGDEGVVNFLSGISERDEPQPADYEQGTDW